MRTRFTFALALVTLVIVAALFSCGGHGLKRSSFSTNQSNNGFSAQPLQLAAWPTGLPVDKAQPWETMDGAGRVVSSINLQSQFVPGVERFLEAGSVADLGEASRMQSGAPGSETVSWAIYRIPMGTEQPGTIAADVNLRLTSASAESEYYIGVGDYSANTWHWNGPFSVSHVRFNVPAAAYTSALGNLMLAVVAYDGADFDLVGLGVNARDNADTTPPPAPSTPTLTPVAGGVLAEWIPVAAMDLAGYRVYANGNKAFDYIEGGTSTFIPASDDVAITLSAVDVSGNESAQSPAANAAPMTGSAPVVSLTAGAASGRRGDIISLNASGAASYDWDVDGDGTWDITGDTTGTAFANTTNMGIIRPALRAHAAGEGFWMGAVSLIIAGNSRPVVSVSADPQTGPAPLDVTFTILAEDDDGTIAEWHWDMNGDGIYDDWTTGDPNPKIYQYALPGFYNAKFRVVDNEGSWDVDTVTILVTGNTPPVAILLADPKIGDPPLTVTFDAGGSFDADGVIEDYEWDLDNDGVFNEPGEEADAQGTSYVETVYSDPGYHIAHVRIIDDQGAMDTAEAAATVHGGVLQTPDSAGTTGWAPSLAVINGRPAMSYTAYDGVNSFLRYIRAADSAGGEWGAFVTVENMGEEGSDNCLAQVNGRPAIAYQDAANYDLKYIRASDASGNSWGPSIVLDSADDVGRYPSLAVINGYPAISYYDDTNDDLKYVRATNADGSAWGAPMVVDSPSVPGIAGLGFSTTLIVVNGYPAISYWDYDNNDVRYIRATDVNGTVWGTSVLVYGTGDVGGDMRMAVVNGNPAISFIDYSNNALGYVRATDADGTAWGAPITVDGTGIAYGNSLAVIDGFPAISYSPDDHELRYVQATDADGASWGVPLIVDSTSNTYGSCLVELHGYPAISYYDATNSDLEFARFF